MVRQHNANYSVEMHGDGGFTITALPHREPAQQTSPAVKPDEQRQAPAEPSYHLTQEQIDDLKARYTITDLTADEFHQLMDELAASGVVGEDEKFIVPGFNQDGYYTIRRPIILYGGAQKQGEGDRIFGRAYFQDGDILSWLNEYKAKNDAWINWFEQGNDKYSSPLQIMKNIDLYKQFNRDLGRIQSVLNQLS